MNDTSRTFVLVAIITTILLFMHLLPTLTVNGTELRPVNILSELLPKQKGVTEIDVIPKPQVPNRLAKAAKDTTNADSTAVKKVKKPHPGITEIEDYGVSTPSMNHFYAALNNRKSMNRPVRIAYYGDSFIEGDILTCDLREMLQTKFGGTGVGWVDCGSPILRNRRTITQTASGITEYEVVKKPFDHALEGISQRYFRLSEGARLTNTGTKYKTLTDNWTTSTLYFRTGGGLTLKTSVNGVDHETVQLPGSDKIQTHTTKGTMHSVGYTFSGIGSGTYAYGTALESNQGVILDNFSMRGSPGFTLANMPLTTLKQFADLRPYDLIILHFGLNVVSPRNQSVVYKTYAERMKRVVRLFQQAYPHASIMVVSVPDRDERTAEGITTMRGVEELRAYQRLMASQCGVAFYDLFQAMGGTGSMKKLVERKMANKDYTHLSYGGGRVVAEKMYKSILAGYEDFQ